MSIRKKLCGEPRGDGCNKPIGERPYAVRYDEERKVNVVYHIECEQRLPPLEEWTTLPKPAILSIIAEDLVDKIVEDIVEAGFARHIQNIKEKRKAIIVKYQIADDDIKEALKRSFRFRR